MKKRKFHIIIGVVLGIVVLVAASLYGVSSYMLDYSLSYPKEERMTAEHWKARIKSECPWISVWMDSVYQHHCVKDTFLLMPSGYKGHALYLYAPKSTDRTAIVVHGYKVRAEGMLHIAYLYNHDMGYNVLLPDLYGHGESEGDHIQMGWNDRWDVIRWSQVAHEIFKVKSKERRVKNTWQVIHGISMGAATTMAVSGEKTPGYVSPATGCTPSASGGAAPLMNTTSALCLHKYGWSFAEAQQISQVRKSTKPMLFIHGDKDAFVPYAMLRPLYDAKERGRKAIFIAKGSEHAMAYRDHHEEYTRVVKDFILLCSMEWG